MKRRKENWELWFLFPKHSVNVFSAYLIHYYIISMPGLLDFVNLVINTLEIFCPLYDVRTVLYYT